jgi:hypothetical protein
MALSAVLGAAALAGQAPAPRPAAQPPSEVPGVATPGVATSGVPTSGVPAPDTAAPDDDLIEFLGADDVGDADWWEFLKKSAHSRDPPRVPPQDAQQ